MIFTTEQKLILASASPRRKMMLEQVGIRFSVCASQLNEQHQPNETPAALVMRLAIGKARSVAKNNPDSWVIGADTVVCLDNEILGKPGDRDEALGMLMRLAGTTHQVYTGYCLYHCTAAVAQHGYCCSQVRFTLFDRAYAAAYVATGESMDKAGAYGIQGLGSSLVREISGSYTSIVGLPLDSVIALLTRYRIIASTRVD